MKKTRKQKCLRGAIIGFGNMAERGHLPGWASEPRISLQAVCEPNPARRKRARGLLPDARLYACPEDLFAQESLDFVDICTPPPSHAGLMVDALRRGLHVLCEKPFVGTRSELERVRRLANRQRRIAFPVHNWKDAPILARGMEWIRRGLIGRVLHSEFHTLRLEPAVGLTPWRSEKEDAGGGGILLDHGWHGIYVLLNFHARRPKDVSVRTRPSPSGQGQTEHTAHLLLGFGDATASLFLTWRADRRYNSARIYGEEGFVVLEDNRIVLRSRKVGTRVATYRQPLSHGSHHPEWFGPVLDRFLDAIQDRQRAREELEEASLCLEITLRGYASARKGGTPMTIPQRKGARPG
jgi:predicted dehydrogenase